MVNISRNIPTFKFVMWSRTYAEADPLEVAITDTMLIAIARLMSTPRKVSAGMRTTPPPIPAMAPTRPATVEMKRRSASDIGEDQSERRERSPNTATKLRLGCKAGSKMSLSPAACW